MGEEDAFSKVKHTCSGHCLHKLLSFQCDFQCVYCRCWANIDFGPGQDKTQKQNGIRQTIRDRADQQFVSSTDIWPTSQLCIIFGN